MDPNRDLNRDPDMPIRDPSLDNRLETRETMMDRDTGGSNFLAFLIGGLVIAVGLLAFLFYDGGSRDVSTTGSTTPPQIERPSTPTPPSTPSTPSRPAAPAQ